MTLTELRYVVAVYRERHFGRAAESCYVSQPTLSAAIKKLEQELDPRRFFRINRQFIVSYYALKKMVTWSKSRIKLVLDPPYDGEVVTSSERTPLFRDWLGGQGPS